ncbi:MAG: chromate efflux transporter [Anaerolineae bacterium]|nr:chromate efflux transporter [Anaerolineae bacterium]
MHDDTYHVKQIPLPELLRTFFVFGVIGYGGPAAHLALMERELVNRRQWLTRQHFLDLLAAVNLVPGPNSTEMALHIGLLSGGFPGMLAAGAGFILPAVFFSVLLAMIYVAAGSVPAVHGVLIGVQPVILALILSAGYRLAAKVIDSTLMRLLTLIALVLVAFSSAPIMRLFGQQAIFVPELPLILATGFAYVLINRPQFAASLILPILPTIETGFRLAERLVPSVIEIFLRFVLIGGTLFGSGYVLASYLQRTFVDELGWLTSRQLLDVLAIGQSTPGPVLSTSSAAGYVMTASPDNLLSGIPAAVAATIGVFLPAFIVVLLIGRLIPYLRRYPVTLEFLKGVNAGVIALLVGTFANLALTTLVAADVGVDWIALITTALAFIALERFKLSPVLLTIIGVIVGIIRVAVGV